MQVGTKVRMLRKSSDAHGEVGEVMEIDDGKFYVKFASKLGWFAATRRNLEAV